jgi:cyanate lyase
MLGFINDMVYSYGSEMKNLIDSQFIDKIISNLKTFKIKKFEDEIYSQEEVIFFIN